MFGKKHFLYQETPKRLFPLKSRNRFSAALRNFYTLRILYSYTYVYGKVVVLEYGTDFPVFIFYFLARLAVRTCHILLSAAIYRHRKKQFLTFLIFPLSNNSRTKIFFNNIKEQRIIVLNGIFLKKLAKNLA